MNTLRVQRRVDWIKQTRKVDESLDKAVSTLIWVTPLLAEHCIELQIVKNILAKYYGKKFTKPRINNTASVVCNKVIANLDSAVPTKELIERYFVEIGNAVGFSTTPALILMLKASKAKYITLPLVVCRKNLSNRGPGKVL